MKWLAVIGLLTSGGLLMAPSPAAELKEAPVDKIIWYSWEEAVAANKENPRKMFVDVYTDWCGWCKRMDKTTFADKKVVAYLNKNFYPVKLNAEQREAIQYDGKTFTFKPDYGRRGVHQLAVALLDGRMSYPSYVYLDELQQRVTISPGYKPSQDLMKELQYVAGEHYKTTKFQDFKP